MKQLLRGKDTWRIAFIIETRRHAKYSRQYYYKRTLSWIQANTLLFKAYNRNTIKRCEMCLKYFTPFFQFFYCWIWKVNICRMFSREFCKRYLKLLWRTPLKRCFFKQYLKSIDHACLKKVIVIFFFNATLPCLKMISSRTLFTWSKRTMETLEQCVTSDQSDSNDLLLNLKIFHTLF